MLLKYIFKPKLKESNIALLITATIVYSLLILVPNYIHYPVSNIVDIIKILFHLLVSSLGLFVVFAVVSFNRYLFSIFFPLIILLSSITAYFVWKIDVYITGAILESIFLTDREEVNSYLSISLILWVLINLFISILFVIWRFKIKITRNNFVILLILVTVSATVFVTMDFLRGKSFSHRSPFSYYSAYKDFRDKDLSQDTIMLLKDENINFQSSEDSLIVVLVIGESLRADHIQMNGYHRNTMPFMEKRGVISLPNVYSPYTHTSASLCYMLTRATQDDETPMYQEGSFISLFKDAGFHTGWIANQNPLTTFKKFIDETDFSYINKPYNTDYSNAEKYDSDLIEPFNNFIKEDYKKTLSIIHLAGNHWWYNKNMHKDFVRYTPVLKNREFSTKNRQVLINSYDNVTLFVDYVLEEMIKKIENKNAFLIFISDHGESFGENGKWLHANDSDYERNPACFIWFSNKYKELNPVKVDVLNQIYNKEIDTSFLFHTILDGSSINSSFLDIEQSLFSK